MKSRLDPTWVQLIERLGPGKVTLIVCALVGLVLISALGGGPDRSAGALPPGGQPIAAQNDPLEAPGTVIDLMLKLGGVLVLAYISLGLLRRYAVGGARVDGDRSLQVLESTTLAPNRAVYLVRAGNKRLVLGVTTSQITTLAELEPETDAVFDPVLSSEPAPRTPAASA